MSIVCDDCGFIIDPYGRCKCYDRMQDKEISSEENENAE